MMTKTDILKKLEEITISSGDDFTIHLRILVVELQGAAEEFFLDICNDKGIDSAIRFTSFYGLYLYCRRFKYYRRIDKYVAMYGDEFADEHLLKIIKSSSYFYKANNGQTSYYNDAIRYAESAIRHIPSVKGVIPNYVDIVSTACFYEVEDIADRVEEALRYIKEEIELKPAYGKYYFLYAKLLNFKGNYEGAISNVNKAIDLEDTTKADAYLRINEYYSELLNIRLEKSKNEIEQKHLSVIKSIEDEKADAEKRGNALINEVTDVRNRNIENLTFFSGILAFIIASISIVTAADNFEKASGLLIVMASMLIFSFGLFNAMNRIKKRIIFLYFTIAFIVIAMLVLGLLIGKEVI